MNLAIVSPYHGGSHKSWVDGYTKHSQHDIQSLTLPDRFWKWRMHGGAITLARKFNTWTWQPDVILSTDMLDLTTFLALTRSKTRAIPMVLYMHENQLTYPLPKDKSKGGMRRQLGERDQHYAFINYASMLTADLVCFNSQFHFDSFFAALTPFLKHFPEYNELHTVQLLKEKSIVLPVGIAFETGLEAKAAFKADKPPLILWNQRWEYDKNPEAFFRLLYRLSEMDIPFELAVCGQQYGKRPFIFKEAAEKLNHHIIHFGFAEKEKYQHLLRQAEVTISTAHHEFFGISILEAIGNETFPLLPNRLSYPQLISKLQYPNSFYETEAELFEKLIGAVTHREETHLVSKTMAIDAQKFSWQHIAPNYDTLFASLLN